MNEKSILKIAGVVVAVLLIINLIQISRTRRDIEQIRQQMTGMDQRIYADLGHHHASMHQQLSDEVQRLLREEHSLFTDASVALELEGDQLVVTMAAVPKEMTHEERLFASVSANGMTHEKEFLPSEEAVIKMDLTPTITPAFILRSDEGVRQEILPDHRIEDILSFQVFTEWSDAYDPDRRASPQGSSRLNLWLTDIREEGALSEIGIESATILLIDRSQEYEAMRDHPHLIETGEYDRITELIQQSEHENVKRVPLEPVDSTSESRESKTGHHYLLDVKDKVSDMEGHVFEIHFLIQTDQGIRFMNVANPVATIDTSQGMLSSSGSERMVPIFD